MNDQRHAHARSSTFNTQQTKHHKLGYKLKFTQQALPTKGLDVFWNRGITPCFTYVPNYRANVHISSNISHPDSQCVDLHRRHRSHKHHLICEVITFSRMCPLRRTGYIGNSSPVAHLSSPSLFPEPFRSRNVCFCLQLHR